MSGSKSSASTSSVTENYDQRVGASDNANVIQNSSVQILDGEAIRNSLNFATSANRDSLQASAAATRDALEFGGFALQYSDRQNQATSELIGQTQGYAFDAYDNAARYTYESTVNALDVLNDANARTQDFAFGGLDAISKTQSAALKEVAESQKEGTQQISEQVVKGGTVIAIVIAVAVTAIFIFKK